MVVKLENVSFSYPGGRPLFEGFSMEIAEGERVALVGPNGGGKTTLMNIVMGLLKVEAGTVELFGRECRNEEDFARARRRMGYVFQDTDDQLFMPSLLEDVVFGPLNFGWNRLDAVNAARTVLGRLGIAHLENVPPYRMSGGERRLGALATVLVTEPEVLLLDEPTSDLDAGHRDLLVSLLDEMDITLLVASHDEDFLRRTTARRIVLPSARR